ncbi:MAG: hypothetical protein HFACDABA_01963 [Anaerolineales bacterium]|nr:hypothetical protein [Anaerolineales bacterium]
MRALLISILFVLTACASPANTDVQIVDVYATPAAGAWLAELYACADSASVVLNFTPDSPEILLRVGEPRGLSTPAFQIDSEEILVVVHRASPIQNMSLQQTQTLFGGQGDPSLQIRIYAPGDDIQAIFEHSVMQSRNIVSSARVAVDPQHMSDLLNAEINAVGILPRHWKAGDTREVFSAGMFPVLAITQTEPQGVMQQLIACLQK